MKAWALFLLSTFPLLIYAKDSQETFPVIEQLLNGRKYEEALTVAENELIRLGTTPEPWEFGELILLKGKALTHLYRIDEAKAAYDSLATYGRSIGHTGIETWGLNALVVIAEFNGEVELAERCSKRVLEIGAADTACYSDALSNLANGFVRRNQNDSALLLLHQAIKLDSLSGAVRSIHFNCSAVAEVYESMGEIDKALVEMQKGYNYLRPGIDDFKKASFEQGLAQLFLAQNNIQLAKEYGLKGKKSATENNLRSKLADINLVLGHVARAENDLQLAQRNYERALPYLLEKKISRSLIPVYASLAEVAIEQGKMKDAYRALQEAKRWSADQSDRTRTVPYYAALTRYQLERGAVDEAVKTLQIVTRNRLPEVSMYKDLAHFKLARAVKRKQGAFEEALLINDQIISLKDSLFRTEQARVLNEMEGRFNKVQNEKEIARLDAEREIQDLAIQQKDFQLKAGTTVALVLVGLGLFMLYQYRTIKRINVEVNKKNTIITSALEEKELLLREIHHRVKNNLQVISSLLSLQSRDINDGAALEAVNESRNRVKSMALIHQNLYQEENLTGIDMGQYIGKLAKSLLTNYKIDRSKVDLVTDIDELNLDVDTTIPLGLILNELLTNTLKYAFPDGREGRVEIRLKEEDQELLLEVRDNGVGYDPQAERGEESSGFGMNMIKTFSKKLKAEHRVWNDGGMVVELKIKKYKLAS